jgi:DNA helicase HerA-like ATPase
VRNPILEAFAPKPKKAQPREEANRAIVVRQVARPSGRVWHISKDLIIDPADYAQIGERDIVMAASGNGKSYLMGVILEECLDRGTLTVIFDPEGETHTLKERYPSMLIVGGEHDMAKLDMEDLPDDTVDALVKHILIKRIPVIFDLSEMDETKDQQLFFTKIVLSFFHQKNLANPCSTVKIVVDEAHTFAPQNGGEICMKAFKGKNSLTALILLAKRGRKRGLNIMCATQRPQSISKDVVTQCNRYFLGHVMAEQDLRAMSAPLSQAGILPEQLKILKPGEFYFSGNGQIRLFKARKRYCKHGGSTPTPSGPERIASQADTMEILNELHIKNT